MSGAGRGQAIASAGGLLVGSWLDHDHFQPAARMDGVDGQTPTKPEVASTDRDDIAVAWRLTAPDGTSVARARYKAAELARSAAS